MHAGEDDGGLYSEGHASAESRRGRAHGMDEALESEAGIQRSTIAFGETAPRLPEGDIQQHHHGEAAHRAQGGDIRPTDGELSGCRQRLVVAL